MSVSLIGPPRQPDPVVHVMVWESSPADLRGVAGFGPVASSLPPEELTAWWMALRGLLDAPPAEAGSAVEGLLFVRIRVGTYLYAVIARTRPVHDDLGRPGGSRAQVLIGPAGGVDVPGLDCPTALGLSVQDWSEWHEPAAGSRDRLRPLKLEWIRERGQEGLPWLRQHGVVDPERTAILLLRILASCGSAQVVAKATATSVADICAAWDIVGQAIPAPWTFNSRAASASGLDAWLGFVLEPRPKVPLPEDDEIWLLPFLRALAERYADGGPEHVAAFRPTRVLQVHDDALAWAKALSMAPGVLRDDDALLAAVSTGNLGHAELSYLGRQGVQERLTTLLSRMPLDRLAALVRTWSPTHAAGQIAGLLKARILDQAMARVRDGDTGGGLLEAIQLQARRHPDGVRHALWNTFDADLRDLEGGRRRLAGGPGHPDGAGGQGWREWQQAAWRAEEITRILPEAGRQAFSRLPSFALLQHVLSGSREAARQAAAAVGNSRVQPDETIGQPPDDSVRIAWDVLRNRHLRRGDRVLIRRLLTAPGWLSGLPDAVTVLARTGHDGRTASRAFTRYQVYCELLAAEAVRPALVGRRGLLWPESAHTPSHMEDTLLLAMRNQNARAFTRRHRRWLLEAVAKRFHEYVLNR